MSSLTYSELLEAQPIRLALKQAWEDSKPGTKDAHEEGGFIVRNRLGQLAVIRWPRGKQNQILVPPHASCKIDGNEIVATFHTHPNTGDEYLQEPSETDKRAVQYDPDLKGEFYVGEFVIARATIYLIKPNGQVSEIAKTETYFVADR